MSANTALPWNSQYQCHSSSTKNPRSLTGIVSVKDLNQKKNHSKLKGSCLLCASKSHCPAVSLMQAIPEKHGGILFHSHSVKAGESIFHSGDPLQAIYILKSGAVKTFMPTSNDQEQVVGFCMPGNLFGIDALANNCHDCSAVALEHSNYCSAPVSQVRSVVRQYFPEWLAIQASEELVREQHNMLILNQRNAMSRMAAFILRVSQRFNERGYSRDEFNLSMAREDIGNHLGLAMETVSRTLSRLQQRKIIRVERRKLVILDQDELRNCLD